MTASLHKSDKHPQYPMFLENPNHEIPLPPYTESRRMLSLVFLFESPVTTATLFITTILLYVITLIQRNQQLYLNQLRHFPNKEDQMIIQTLPVRFSLKLFFFTRCSDTHW